MMWPLALILVVASIAQFLARMASGAVVFWWNKLPAEPISALVMLLGIAVLVAATSAGLLRWLKPETHLVPSPFELSSTSPKGLPITGKIAADMLVTQTLRLCIQTGRTMYWFGAMLNVEVRQSSPSLQLTKLSGSCDAIENVASAGGGDTYRTRVSISVLARQQCRCIRIVPS